MPDEINTLTSVIINNETVLSHAPAEAQGVALESAAYSISLFMLNAVSTQFAASQIGNASVVSACAEILKAASSDSASTESSN
jgi:hypothetical protein